ncbi:solute carrier family 15 member 1 [Paramormyrops kingsleyae]|uniref:Solute carrier family 15 member 1b n=1 Tax=Paramormyrops kingsleyae TaxID=1676925 RepID=A0A3B3SFH3_9TELE|nr:solute carrier family 15 member 1 [Paramormyrops kingsleyae]
MPEKENNEKRAKYKVEVCGYPLSIFFIVINEFCERFSYYGMKAVLVLYFRYFLKWDDDLATSIYHTFVALCYLTPILGAIVADSWLGKFKTIIYLSIVYTIGQLIMAVSTISDITGTNSDGTPNDITVHVILSMLGLSLIALGTGGIKPCVAAFGGDQFQDHQEKQRSTFFSIFYLSINAGSLLSTIITPTLRATECGSSHQQCYPLAFGVPAALMLVALIVFIAGSGMYDKPDPQGNIILQVCKCIGFALKNRFKHRSSEFSKREHWMDWASEKYDKLLIAQIKMLVKVLFLYIPLPMFWALFDQQGSRWTLQATTMDGNFGAITIQPDQMQTVNPILILVMVPVMDNVVYPIIKKCHLNFTPLRRMTVGMFLAALAFIAAALLQIQIDKTMPIFPSSSEGQVKFLNLRDTPVSVKVNDVEAFHTEPFKATADYLTYNTDNISVALNMDNPQTFPLQKGQRKTFLITPNFQKSYMIDDLTSKPDQGKNEIRFVNGLATKVTVSKGDFHQDIGAAGVSNSTIVSQGKSTFTITSERLNCTYSKDFGFGSSYTFLISSKSSNCQETIVPVEDIAPNSVHMAWLIPQYFILTTGEVVFSVTGLEFSYSQAPSNMKSVLQAGWLFTVAVGNIIVLIVAEAGAVSEQWAEYVLFACLLMLVCVIFAIMGYFYIYVDPVEIEAKFLSGEDDEKDKNKEKDGWNMESIELNNDEKKTKV